MEAVEGLQVAVHQNVQLLELAAVHSWEVGVVVVAGLAGEYGRVLHRVLGAAGKVVARWAQCHRRGLHAQEVAVAPGPGAVELPLAALVYVDLVQGRPQVQQPLQRHLASHAKPGWALGEQVAVQALSLQSVWMRPFPWVSRPLAVGALRYWVPCALQALWASAPPS